MAEKRSRRRTRGEGSLYQRADGIWIGCIDLGWVDGQRRRITVSGKTKTRALTRLTELKQQIAEHGVPEKAAGWTVAAWLRYWLENAVGPERKPRTYTAYRVDIERHIIPALGAKRRLVRLEPHHVEAMLTSLRTKTSIRGEPLSPTTIRHIHQTLSVALGAAKRRGLVRRNVADFVDRPTGRNSNRESMAIEDARRVLLATANDRLGSRWLAALLTGARQGECLGLRWEFVDFDRNLIDYAWQLQRIEHRHGCGTKDADGTWPCGQRLARKCPNTSLAIPNHMEYTQLDGGLCLITPKSDAGTRVVPMVGPLRLSLELRRAAYLTERETYATDHRLVWPRPDGAPIRPADDLAAWHDALRAVGAPEIEVHAARHTTSTLLLEAGVDVKVIQEIVGHSQAVTTRGYQHVSTELARRALDQLGNVLELETG